MAFVTVLSACSPAANPQPSGSQPAPATSAEQPKKGGIVRIGVQQLEAYLDPIDIKSGFVQHLTTSLYDVLIDIDAKSNLAPALATEWQIGPDGKTTTLKLRQNVKFHDGTAFDATVAKWNLDRIKDPKVNPEPGLVASLQQVDIVDPNTIKLTLKEPDISLLYAFASYHSGIVSPNALKVGADGKKTFDPIGTGPYKVDGTPTADKATLVRFDGYWDAAHTYLDKIELDRVPDPTVRLSGLKAGDLDIIDAPASTDIPAIKADSTLAYMDRPGNIQARMPYLVNQAPFDNINLRRAMAYAIDRDAINKAAYAGLGTVHQNIMYPSHWGYDPSFQGIPLDLNKAKEELQKGGQPNGFKFQAVVTNREPELTIAQAMKAQLIKVGIDMDIVPLDSSKGLEDFVAGKYPARLATGSRGAEPVNHLQEWVSDSPGNYYGYKDKDVDAHVALLRTNSDMNARVAALKKLNQIMIIDDPAFLRLVEANDFKAWNAKLRGVAPEYSYPFRAYKFWWSDTPQPRALKQ
jgi:peptide/nickel transport system substrate-binding protein